MHTSVKPMHIPDGFLSVPVSLVLWALSLPIAALQHASATERGRSR
jgi:ABC-type Co2+ transport system permease subunit